MGNIDKFKGFFYERKCEDFGLIEWKMKNGSKHYDIDIHFRSGNVETDSVVNLFLCLRHIFGRLFKMCTVYSVNNH